MPSHPDAEDLLRRVEALEERCEAVEDKASLDAYVDLCCIGQAALLPLLSAVAHIKRCEEHACAQHSAARQFWLEYPSLSVAADTALAAVAEALGDSPQGEDKERE